MIGKAANSIAKPTALGVQAQSSVYGQTIPVIMGRARVPVKLIWAQNLRKSGGSSKPFKSKKKGQPTYAMNVDMLLGTNPLGGVLQFWTDNNQKLALDFTGDYSIGSDAIADGLITVPDGNFYYVLGVTAEFTDPANPSSGQFKLLWNAAFGGPDPVNNGGYRNYPFCYWWIPGSGPTIYFDAAYLGQMPDATLHVYYAKLTSQSHKGSKKGSSGGSSHVPVAAMRLTFEPQLGEGSEYAGYTAQRIIYPHYAGVGSPNLDLGTSAALPNILAEVAGAFPIWEDGQADFADMVEHIVKSGPTQSGFDAESNHDLLQQGLGCYDYPGFVQKKERRTGTAGNLSSAFYDLPNSAGNILIVAVSSDSASGLDISDDAGNAWTALLGAGPRQVWWAAAVAWAAGNNVSITGLDGDNPEIQLMEVAGMDTVDDSSVITDATAPLVGSITTTNAAGQPALILALALTASGASGFLPDAAPANWKMEMGNATWINPAYERPFLNQLVMSRVVRNPGTYEFSAQPSYSGSDRAVLMIALKNSEPVRWPRSLGEILDVPSLELCRDQCRVNGLKGSIALESQQKAMEYLTTICQAMNAAPVWDGFKLRFIPWSETSVANERGVYVAPGAGDPGPSLVDQDFIGDASQPVIKVKRSATVDAMNLMQFQHPSRDADYNNVITGQPEQAGIALFGQRKEAPKQMNCIYDVAVARPILAIAARRAMYIRESFEFTLNAKWKLAQPMDRFQLTDKKINLIKVPVRLTSVDEDGDFNLKCTAEPYFEGLHAPVAVAVGENGGFVPDTGETPDLINDPIFLEPVARLAGLGNAPELWIGVSDASATYGGCIAYLSTDGGSSYVMVGSINGNAVTGETVGDFPVHADPDTANDLVLDTTESLGTLSSYSTADRDNFVYAMWLDGGVGDIPYELISWNTANLTGTNEYTLKATGGGNEVRRSVFSAPTPAVGVDHPDGTRFLFLDPSGQGLLKLQLDPKWIGQTLHFKFTGFNNLGGGIQALNDVTDYTYTPTGGVNVNPNANNYTNDPAADLSQTNATTLAMASTEVTFPSNKVKYNARTFTISDPGGTPQVYFVTIHDPGYVGDIGTGTDKTAYCETTQAKVGVPGYTYMGSILAVHAPPTGNIVTIGGWPPDPTFLVNGS